MEIIQQIIDMVEEDPDTEVIIDLETCQVRAKKINKSFKIDDFTRQRFLKGLTDIELSLLYEDDIEKYEQTRYSFYPKISQ